ncbi:TlpA family protein disulfide reductase [Streptomyces sp. A7024]|uniref:TlpA family protein disulfide reductase n=1 Tax=Streptomyces coryli TaxID=1128680 RepID=A0A6G4TVA5_9ACTN|nr:TlpA disulfide reductase family protein [Streptomyces coryli]NGN63702.1 TlpA family protein disulfide reductase [Streptomyces coryli]
MIFSSGPRARRNGAALALAGATAILLAGCGSDDGNKASGGNNTQFVAGTGKISTVKAADRIAAPDISGKTTHGDQLKLSDFKGKVVVINVWGSWCAPCRAEAPNLKKVADDTEDKDVQFLGINTRDLEVNQAKAFDRSFGIKYPSLYDPAGKLILKFPKGTLSPQAIPSTLILDRDGKIAARALKPLTEKELRKALDPVVAEKPAE